VIVVAVAEVVQSRDLDPKLIDSSQTLQDSLLSLCSQLDLVISPSLLHLHRILKLLLPNAPNQFEPISAHSLLSMSTLSILLNSRLTSWLGGKQVERPGVAQSQLEREERSTRERGKREMRVVQNEGVEVKRMM